MRIGDFFLWCSGTDPDILVHCEKNVRIRQQGLGSLVLIPAILGWVSMSYALSTIDQIHGHAWAYLGGGLIWGCIIFCFDRYIVSTHRKQEKQLDEIKNITFYLRLFFAIILGIIISHPFVLLYFDGSIEERIIQNRDHAIIAQETQFKNSYDSLTVPLQTLIQRRRCNEQLLTAEQSGKKLDLPCGSSSGIPNITGTFPRTQEIKKILAGLDTEIQKEEARIAQINQQLTELKKTQQANILQHTSFDYLKREVALSELKKENPIIGWTEFLLILAFILLDILPLIFKTFSSFTLYDKILCHDPEFLRGLDTQSRRIALQRRYEAVHALGV